MTDTVSLTTPKFIRQNHNNSMPNRYVFLDTEANRTPKDWGERQSFRLAVLRFDRRRTVDQSWSENRYETVHNTDTLWDRVDAFTHRKGRTVVVCHNLGYDLLISNAFNALPARDWQIESCNIESNRAWMVWGRDGRTLILTDMLSWIGQPLHKIAKWVGMVKPELPAWDESDEAWEIRCKADVAIMGDAWHRMMTWVEENECGMWRPTGAGMSWSAYRHKFYQSGVQHHGRQELYDMERRATWTGRCEAWRHGKLEGGPFTEWDMTLAYANIARECQVPIAPYGRAFTPSLGSFATMARRAAVLATVTVTTDAPVVPAEVQGRIAWPVGTFETTLWNPEITLAREYGADIQIHQMEVYRTAPILQKWGEWITQLLAEADGETDPIVRAMLKGWARTVIGRFGLKYSTWQHWGPSPFPDICAFTLYEKGNPQRKRCVSIGNDTLVEGAEEEAPDSCPSVMGWIMSECRARLYREMAYVGFDNIAYCDTDSLWTGPVSELVARKMFSRGWRPKQTWRDVEILGPRQLILSGQIKASGIPYKARKSKGRRWTAETWSAPLQQLRTGQSNTVDIARRRGTMSAPDLRRLHLEGGYTKAHRLAQEAI